jgi:hypothetical protein
MASNPPLSRPPSGQSFFQKKELGLPVWAWALIGVGAAGALYLYMRSRSTSSAATPAAQPVTAPSSSGGGGGFGVGGYGGAGTPPSGLEPGAPAQPAPPPAPASPGNPSLPFQVQSGSGWWTGSPQQAQAQPITDAAGNEYEWLDSAEYQSVANSGIQVYYEVLPGVFVPVPAGLAGLAGGTPLYMQVPSGTATNPAAPTSSATNHPPLQMPTAAPGSPLIV